MFTLLAIDGDVAVTNHLPCLTPRDGKAQPVGHVVQAPLELLDEQFAGDAGGAVGLFVVLAELAFEREVHALGLLLLMQLQAVAHDLGLAILAVHARGKVALLNRATVGKALGALQKKLGAFATAKAADWSCITCHFFLLLTSDDGRFTLLVRACFVPALVSSVISLAVVLVAKRP
jgi:hypothetical protein